ncbi:hypothetical protein ETAA8_29750 [Anatilimnocola aggregata]|uniref:Uncharacterized protein n=1 Tax=Anatilimnocola aggregata TaxID=2528021 RepID=A0A517YCD2_9BACT|nr:hypothetical protein ETAA8_29750 [Anatilimnocola aggregata]
MTRWLLTATYYGTWLPGDKRGSAQRNVGLHRRPNRVVLKNRG